VFILDTTTPLQLCSISADKDSQEEEKTIVRGRKSQEFKNRSSILRYVRTSNKNSPLSIHLMRMMAAYIFVVVVGFYIIEFFEKFRL
jgi:hypothetical protein